MDVKPLLADLYENNTKTGWPWNIEVDPKIYIESIDWPKITIISPSLNQSEFIEENIRSILFQNYPNLELIIIDGGSTDGTIDIIKKYEKWITYWVSELDKGQSQAINKGLKRATGELFNWINSDDYLAPEALFHIGTAYIKSHPQVICGLTTNFQQETMKKSVTYLMGVKDNVEETYAYPLMNQPGTFFQTVLLKQLGFINESMNYIMDVEFWRRYLACFGIDQIIQIKQQICFFRYHGTSKSTLSPDSFNDEFSSLDLYISQLLNYPDYYIDWLKTIMNPNTNYISEKWIFQAIDIKVLKSIQVRDFLLDLYNQGQRKTCRSFLYKYPGYKMPIHDIKFLKLYLKVMLLPENFELFLRKIINQIKSWL